MQDDRKISICLTHFNRPEMLVRAFKQFIDDDRISEIIIVDDNSENLQYINLLELISTRSKVKVFKNDVNIGCFRNKKRAIELATNEFACLWDSDNVFDKSYIDKIYAYGLWDKQTIYAPSQAGKFDYRHFEGRMLHRQNIKKFVGATNFEAMINTMNYFVNRDEYLRVWNDKEEPHAIDSMYQNLQWLTAGNKFFVVPGLKYEHTVHPGSVYMKEGHLTLNLRKAMMDKFKAMK